MNMMYISIGATVIVGILFIFINWQNAGAAKSVSCTEYPQYCVPLAGSVTSTQTDLETEGTRELDEDSHGAEGVVRYIAADNVPTIGNPDAPIHIRTVSNFTCGHCNTYHTDELERFIEDYALTGQATVGLVLIGQDYSKTAALGALCAGEQGAFWEMSDEMFRLARARGAGAFTLDGITNSADDMKLDADDLNTCVAAETYVSVLNDHSTFAMDNGVSSTPSVFIRYAGNPHWTKLEGKDQRAYNNLAALTQDANAN